MLNNDEMTISTKRTLKNLRQALTQLLKLKQAIHKEKVSTVPMELLATIYANTIITVGKWWLEHGENYEQEDVYKFFKILIK